LKKRNAISLCSFPVLLGEIEFDALSQWFPTFFAHGLGQFGAVVSVMEVANVLCEKNVCF